MKTFFKTIIPLVILFAPNLLPAQQRSQEDSLILFHEFQQQTEKWKQAYNSDDAKNLIPLYAEDADYISSHVNGLVAKGRENLIAYFQNGLSAGGHIDSIEILSMNLSCELATLLCRYQATNSGQKAVGRNLLVLKKINGHWLIVLHMTVV